MRHTALAASIGRSKHGSSRKASARRIYPFFAVCIKDKGYGISLHFGKVYRVIKPRSGDLSHDLRVIDEEGEDYLYPADWFAEIQMSPSVKRKVSALIH
jgi:hypothetical protein